MSDPEITVGEYLLIRLKEVGIDHLFGVPGDFVLGFLDQVSKSDVKFVGTCNELNAAYAADGYARVRGIGGFCSTYGVGELSAVNGVAGAFAERVPVVVVTGAPATVNFTTRPLLHHTLGDYEIQQSIYEKVTVAATRLSGPETAPSEIDRVLAACLIERRPVYISLPSDVVMMKCGRPGAFAFPPPAVSDRNALDEAVHEALAMLGRSVKPVVIAGMELLRFGLRREFGVFLEKTGLPYATMMLGKAVLSERHPGFIGLFEGDRSGDSVRRRVESADCVLLFGALMSDLNTGGFTDGIAESKTIGFNMRSVRIGHHRYENVNPGDFILGLAEGFQRRDPGALDIRPATQACAHRDTLPYHPDAPKALTVSRFFDRMSHFLARDTVLVAETGVSLFGAAETLMPEGATFIGQAFYGSIGYTVGAALGAGIAARDRPVVLFVGDGAFQVACQELSTMIRNRLKIHVFLLNNDGYTIERMIVDRPYDDIQPWRYHKLVEVFGGGLAFDVRTEGELEDALAAAPAAAGLVFVEIHTGRLDGPESLRGAGRSMAKANQLGP